MWRCGTLVCRIKDVILRYKLPLELRAGPSVSQEIELHIDTGFVFHYVYVMRNITVSLPEDVAHWLRVRAAENSRSVSKWLADLLAGMRRREDEYEVAMERFLARKPRKLQWSDDRKPTRDELHDRAGLR